MALAASPVARRAAQRLGVELAALTGSGPRGRILKADVARAAAQPPPVAVAAAPVSVTADVDLTAALELCAQLDGVEPIDLVIRAVALAEDGVDATPSLGAIAAARAASPPPGRTPMGIVDLGPAGADAGTPRLTSGQTAVLCVGAGRQRPHARDGALVLAMVATLTLVCGEGVSVEDGAGFLADLRARLEAPLALAFA
jgi:pyruvate/2-oxoglutarate dehydrogenase complex dihydrolipoamide acyltransferase (E2) component